MDKRAQAADETRRRIVEACFELHARQGIAATTMTQVAEVAGVGIGTVYHYFPSYEDAVTACGAFTAATVPLPTSEALAGSDELGERLEALAAAVFDFYDRLEPFVRIRAERDRFEPVHRFVEHEESNRRALTRAALEPFGADEATVQLVAALLDAAVYDELRRAGYSPGTAARSVAITLTAGLENQLSAATRRHTQSPRTSRGLPHGNPRS
jgi:AcrR family transcriptional regulator